MKEPMLRKFFDKTPLVLHKKAIWPTKGECEGGCGKMCRTVMYLVKGYGYMFSCKECRDIFKAKWCKDPDNPTFREWSRFAYNREHGYSR